MWKKLPIESDETEDVDHESDQFDTEFRVILSVVTTMAIFFISVCMSIHLTHTAAIHRVQRTILYDDSPNQMLRHTTPLSPAPRLPGSPPPPPPQGILAHHPRFDFIVVRQRWNGRITTRGLNSDEREYLDDRWAEE